MTEAEKLKITGVDRMGDKALICFSNGSSVLFQAQFLWSAWEQSGNLPVQDGNLPIPGDVEEREEPVILTE